MRPPKHLTIALLLTALLAIAAAGCGGGGGSTTASSTEPAKEAVPTLSKEELIKQGDAICAEVNAAVGSVGNSAAEPSSQVTQAANLYIDMVASLKRLGVPKEKSSEYDEFIAAADELAKVEGEVKLAAERNDSTALGEAGTKATPVLESFETTAGAYGFEHCSEGPSAPTVSGSSTEPPAEGEEGGVEVAPEEVEEGAVEEAAPEEVAPETGGAGGAPEEVGPEEGGGEESGGNSGGVGPG